MMNPKIKLGNGTPGRAKPTQDGERVVRLLEGVAALVIWGLCALVLWGVWNLAVIPAVGAHNISYWVAALLLLLPALAGIPVGVFTALLRDRK